MMAKGSFRLEGPFYDQVKAEVEAFIASLRDKMVDGLDFRDLFALVQEAVERVVGIIAELDGTNAEKRELLLDLIDTTYSDMIAPIDLPWVPNLFEGVVDRLIGQALHSAVDAALHRLLPGSGSANPNA